MRLIGLVVACVVLGRGVAARADTVYNVQGNFVMDPSDLGGSMLGTLTFNSVTGTFSGIDITVTQRQFTGRYTVITSQVEGTAGTTYGLNSTLSPGVFLFLEFPDAGTLAGASSLSLCSTAAPCAPVTPSGYEYNPFRPPLFFDYLSTGTVTPAASVTPECSGLVLVATGLVGLAGMVRWRVGLG